MSGQDTLTCDLQYSDIALTTLYWKPHTVLPNHLLLILQCLMWHKV